jgi:hypothetical protein
MALLKTPSNISGGQSFDFGNGVMVETNKAPPDERGRILPTATAPHISTLPRAPPR